MLFWRLAVHVLGAVVLALLVAAPYLPVLLNWAGTGGAFETGFEDAGALAAGARSTTAGGLLGGFTLDALGVDLPVRVGLLGLGLLWAVRQARGRPGLAIWFRLCGLAVA